MWRLMAWSDVFYDAYIFFSCPMTGCGGTLHLVAFEKHQLVLLPHIPTGFWRARCLAGTENMCCMGVLMGLACRVVANHFCGVVAVYLICTCISHTMSNSIKRKKNTIKVTCAATQTCEFLHPVLNIRYTGSGARRTYQGLAVEQSFAVAIATTASATSRRYEQQWSGEEVDTYGAPSFPLFVSSDLSGPRACDLTQRSTPRYSDAQMHGVNLSFDSCAQYRTSASTLSHGRRREARC